MAILPNIKGGGDMSEWISVKDRLPEGDKNVLICDVNCPNNYEYPYIIDESYEIAFYSERSKHFCLCAKDVDWVTDNVTHWMPLPEPPNGS